jgi:ureidoacrylate peracid hydrolase
VTVSVEPDRTAVLVIDAQNDFCHPDGLLARQGRDLGRVQPALQRLTRLLDGARRAGALVVFVRNLHSPTTDTPQWLLRHRDPDREQSCQAGTWGAEFCGVAPEAGDLVVDKHRYSAFTNPELASQLRAQGRDSLLFTGFTTNVCVESSLREGVCRDFVATLVADCCAAYSDDAHLRAVRAVQTGFGSVVDSDELLADWAWSVAPPTHTVPTGADL